MMLSAITMKPSDATQIMPLPTRIVVWPTFAPVTAPRLMLTLRQRGGSRGQIQNGRQPQSSVVVVKCRSRMPTTTTSSTGQAESVGCHASRLLLFDNVVQVGTVSNLDGAS